MALIAYVDGGDLAEADMDASSRRRNREEALRHLGLPTVTEKLSEPVHES